MASWRGGSRRWTGAAWARWRDALEASIRAEVRWQGADLDRLLAEGHPALHEAIAALFARLDGWTTLAEVSFAIGGERGVIDLLAWHAPTRSLLIVELKTALGDPQALVATMDRRIRLARRIAAERGWSPATVSAWVVFADSRTNRRHVTRHRLVASWPVPGGRPNAASLADGADHTGDGAQLLDR